MDSPDRYEARAWCGNCEFFGVVHPVVGTWVSSEPCPVCQVKSLVPMSAHYTHSLGRSDDLIRKAIG